jgi:hypothetical protein
MVSPTTPLLPEPLDPKLCALYRAATPERKLAVVARLNATLIGLKEADLRTRFPAQSTAERRTMLRRWWFAARD